MKSATIDLRLLSAISAFSYVGEDRYYLAGVRLEIEERSITYVASDGHRLLAWRVVSPDGADAHTLAGRYTIPSPQCRALGDQGKAGLFGERDQLEMRSGNMFASFVPIKVEKKFAVDGWVDWRRVVPKSPLSRIPSRFNGDYIASFHKFADQMSDGLQTPIVFHNGPEGPAVIRFPWHADAVGVLMPMRMPKAFDDPVPGWALPPAKDCGEVA